MQPARSSAPRLVEIRRCDGRALMAVPDGTWYASRGYAIYESKDEGRTWQFVARMPCKLRRRVAAVSRLACRLLRHEARALNRLSDGTIVAANREGVYYDGPGQPWMQPAVIETGTQKPYPPMSITVGPKDRIIWGEYNSWRTNEGPVRLYVSDDRGRTYQIARVFADGEILHVHTLVYDSAISKYWLFSGDHGHEPGIGLLSVDLKDFDWLVKGQQQYRAVDVFDFGDHFIYGMDSEREQNWIVAFDKKSGRIERIAEIEGSCIYSCRFGSWYVLSTTVEPSKVNFATAAGLWASRDGHTWSRVFEAEKDAWPHKLFQYGSLVLPRGAGGNDTLFFSGQAVRGLDGKLLTARIDGC
jgi:hypothetical protein